jgi:hypothetical protein
MAGLEHVAAGTSKVLQSRPSHWRGRCRMGRSLPWPPLHILGKAAAGGLVHTLQCGHAVATKEHSKRGGQSASYVAVVNVA